MRDTQLLVVEDDPQMQRLLESRLRAHGFRVTVVDNGPAALDHIASTPPDLVLLDITLPGQSGLDVCRELRDWSTVPVILVTAADMPQTKVEAFGLGADDYLTKPFHVGELVARIEAVMRRAATQAAPPPRVIEVDGLRIDLAHRRVERDGKEIYLTRTEYALLAELVQNLDRVVTHSHLLAAVWPDGYADTRGLHSHICNLRRKLDRDPTAKRRIIAIPGVGYRFRTHRGD